MRKGLVDQGFRYMKKMKPYMNEGAWMKKIKWMKK